MTCTETLPKERKRTGTYLDDLSIASSEGLHQLARAPCPKCLKMCKYFCYRCCLIMGDEQAIPKLKLPKKLDIIKYAGELDGKSTAIHAKLISPGDVQLIHYPKEDLPVYAEPDRVLLLFPGEDAVPVSEISPDSFDRVLVVDGTWSQANRLVRETALGQLRKVVITSQKTVFWRYQTFGESHLATIEAIYYFFREFTQASPVTVTGGTTLTSNYKGEYDNLLFYYQFFYQLIQEIYRQNPNKQYTQRHRSDYIQYQNT